MEPGKIGAYKTPKPEKASAITTGAREGLMSIYWPELTEKTRTFYERMAGPDLCRKGARNRLGFCVLQGFPVMATILSQLGFNIYFVGFEEVREHDYSKMGVALTLGNELPKGCHEPEDAEKIIKAWRTRQEKAKVKVEAKAEAKPEQGETGQVKGE